MSCFVPCARALPHFFCTVLFLYLLSVMPARATEVQLIIVPRPESATDTRYVYPELVLQRILERTETRFGAASLQHANESMSRDRMFIELKQGARIHLMAEAPKPGWEESLIPIRIPIRKGVQGYRVFIIKKSDEALLASVRAFSDLVALPTGSGDQWSTRRVMEEAGFTVVVGTSYEGLFDMLSMGRFRTFGRGINEAYAEVGTVGVRLPALMVDEAVLLYIPLPTYFFVTPKLPVLAQRIEIGLSEMISDGSFDTLFCDQHRHDIEQAKLASRRVFCIKNPNLSPETPLDREEYWTSKACGLTQAYRCQ